MGGVLTASTTNESHENQAGKAKRAAIRLIREADPGRVAVGALAISRLEIGRATIRKLRISELEVDRLVIRNRDPEVP